VHENELPALYQQQMGTLGREEKERNSEEEKWRDKVAVLTDITLHFAARAHDCWLCCVVDLP